MESVSKPTDPARPYERVGLYPARPPIAAHRLHLCSKSDKQG